jgi:protein-tyrosine phosphatase
LPDGTTAPERSRHLDWEGCLNLRDLGGLRTEDGKTTAWGAFVRGDTLCGLSEAGRGSVVGYGIRTVVDLRSAEELDREPNPFAALPDVVSYLHHPLNDPATEERISAQPSGVERYITMVEAGGERIARIFTAFASARPGILFHCYAGRDRTGIVAALLLRLARVDVDTIVRDYEETDERMNARYETWRATLEGTRLERFISSLADRGGPIRTILTRVEDRYGSVGSYLEEHGAARSDVGRVAARIRGAGISGAAGSS